MQVGLLATQVSLPMLAPLLLGTGMLLRSIRTNASFLLPRIGLLVVMLWLLWFANSVVQNTVVYLRRQARAPPAPLLGRTQPARPAAPVVGPVGRSLGCRQQGARVAAAGTCALGGRAAPASPQVVCTPACDQPFHLGPAGD